MSMNSMSKQEIQDAFNDLFTFKDEKEELKHKAQMLGFRFLSEIERISEDRGLKKKDFAKIIGTSPSYITQLFRGDKLVNLETLAKFEKGLNINFDIRIKEIEDTNFDTDVTNKKAKCWEEFQSQQASSKKKHMKQGKS